MRAVAGTAGESLRGPLRWADFDLDLVQNLFPAWRIERMGALLRADRAGYQTKFASSAGLMAMVLGGEVAAVMFASQESRVTGR